MPVNRKDPWQRARGSRVRRPPPRSAACLQPRCRSRSEAQGSPAWRKKPLLRNRRMATCGLAAAWGASLGRRGAWS